MYATDGTTVPTTSGPTTSGPTRRGPAVGTSLRTKLARRGVGLAAALTLVGGLVPQVASAAPAHISAPVVREAKDSVQPRRIMSAWLPYWSLSASLARVEEHADLFTDASPFFYDLTSTGRLVRKSTRTTDVQIADVVTRLHAAGLPVYATVGQRQDAPTMAAFLADHAARAAHVRDLVAEVLTRGYDGIDLDYESMNFGGTVADRTAVREGFVVFVRELAPALHAHGKKLTLTVGPRLSDSPLSNWAVYDYAALGAVADRFRIMTYDYGWKGGKPNPVAPHWWVEKVIAHALTVVPAGKIWLGVPSYGYDWPEGGRATAVTHRQAIALQEQYGAQREWRETVSASDSRRVRAPMFRYTDAAGVAHTVWYSDAASIRALTELVGQYRLGGAAMWSVGTEDPAVWSQLRGYARSIAPVATVVVLKPAKPVVAHGTRSQFTASLRDPEGRPVPAVKALLQRRSAAREGWRTVAAALSSPAGAVTFTDAARPAMEYRVVTQASWERHAAVSEPSSVAVARKLSMSRARAVRKGRKAAVTLRGRVSPAGAGVTVELRRLYKGRWATVTRTKTDARGAFTLSATVASKSRQVYVVRVLNSGAFAPSASGRVPVTAP